MGLTIEHPSAGTLLSSSEPRIDELDLLWVKVENLSSKISDSKRPEETTREVTSQIVTDKELDQLWAEAIKIGTQVTQSLGAHFLTQVG